MESANNAPKGVCRNAFKWASHLDIYAYIGKVRVISRDLPPHKDALYGQESSHHAVNVSTLRLYP